MERELKGYIFIPTCCQFKLSGDLIIEGLYCARSLYNREYYYIEGDLREFEYLLCNNCNIIIKYLN